MLAAIQRILFTRLVTRVVKIVPILFRRGLIVLLDAALHFLKKRLLQWLGMPRDLFEIILLGVQVFQDLGVFLVAEPKVVIYTGQAVLGDLFGAFGGDGE